MKEKLKDALPVIVSFAAVSAGYITLCRIMRGYWALAGDFLVIALGAITVSALYVGLRESEKREGEDR